jgi:WD40 repeat protein
MTYLATGSEDGYLKIWELGENYIKCVLATPFNAPITCMKQTGANFLLIGTQTGFVSIWNAQTD